MWNVLEHTYTNNIVAPSSVPSTPINDLKKAPSFTQEQPQLDSYERALRQRKQEVSCEATCSFTCM